MPTGIVIDVMSIQKYVFGSNKLKDILGASYIVSNLYKIITSDNFSKFNPQIGYIGGGNALVSFNTEQNANLFIKEFTKYCLINYPGLNVAIGKANLKSDFNNPNDENFADDLKLLFQDLEIKKRTFFANNNFYMPGFIADDVVTGQPLSIWYNEGPSEEHGYISMITSIKRSNCEKAKNQFKLKNYLLPDEFDDIIVSKGEDSNIAVVHIDGNNIGQRFKKLKTLENVRKLSNEMTQAIQSSFNYILEHLVDLVIQNKIKINGKYLPLRPIILGGDDITFVTRGNLGLYLSKLFIDKFEEFETSDSIKNSACAGISIVNMKYPFYRAYMIAEELCANAKIRRKKMKSDKSFLDFHVQSGQQSTSIEYLRNEQFKIKNKNLLTRPLLLNDNSSNFDFNKFIEAAKILQRKDKNGKLLFANNKLKELREVIFKDDTQIKEYINQINFRGLELPNLWDCNNELCFIADDEYFNPYIDLIEIAEFYPTFSLK
jgi:hypothetical protein